MGQFVAVIFSDLALASEGARALSALHADGGIAPSGMAVVVKEPSGQWLVKEKTAGGALATVVTALIGGLGRRGRRPGWGGDRGRRRSAGRTRSRPHPP